ncbi:MAG: hypothetical protein FJW20_11530 [Acidimicrobiia bacterium]|nr:hypothetical protein [Acidimicrobiia bacterium]
MPHFSPGDHLGPYEVISLLGTGGMGEVYKAQDQRLRRMVALKVLSRGHAHDSEARQRFLREARILSALQHPNIMAIYDLLAVDGADIIVTELLEGQTLEKLLEAHPAGFPPDRVKDYALQIAAALHKAHSSGVLHRDLKPSNIMVSAEHHVKVLDFGLAKFAAPPVEDQVTLTNYLATRAGTMLGTSAYMSPEQAQGEEIDERSDMFSFGAVLYEMVTGRRAFYRGNLASTLAAVLRDEPEPPSPAAGNLATVIHRCLRKPASERYPSVSALMDSLRHGDSGSLAAPPTATAQPRLPRRQAIFIAAGLLAGLIPLAWIYRPQPPAAKTATAPVTTDGKPKIFPSISPDGNLVAYLDGVEGAGQLTLTVRPVEPGRAIALTDRPVPAQRPAWSPDGKTLAFARAGAAVRGIYVVPALGGPERQILKTDMAVAGLDWSPDGKALAVSLGDRNHADAIWLVDPETREQRLLTHPPAGSLGDSAPVFSPDGRQLAFIRRFGVASSDIFLILLSGGEPRRLTKETHALFGVSWTRDGRSLVFSSRRSMPPRLWRIPAAGGEPQLVAEASEGSMHPHVARNTGRLVYLNRLRDLNLWRADLDPSGRAVGAPRSFIASTYVESTAAFSPDGKLVAFDSQRSGHAEIWLADADGVNPVQLTKFNGPHAAHPSFSPDGNWIALDSRVQGQADIYVIARTGGQPRRLTSSPADEVMPWWSRDGNWIYYTLRKDGVGIHKIPAGGGPAVFVTEGINPRESPDGRFLYYLKNQGNYIWRRPTAGGAEESIAGPVGAGVTRLWTIGPAGIYYFTSQHELSALLFAKPKPELILRITVPAPTEAGSLAISPDGRALLYPQMDQFQTDISMVDNYR